MKLRKLLIESSGILTRKRVEDLADQNNRSNFEILADYWDDPNAGVQSIIDSFNEAYNIARRYVEKYGLKINESSAIAAAFSETSEFHAKVSEYFPLLLYVSTKGKSWDEIGIHVHRNGRVEFFEGNEEASDKTYAAVNRLVSGPKKMQLWASHSRDIVNKINKTKRLPDGLYVSPDKKYAQGFWGEDRVLFSFTADKNDFRQESDVDWKAIGNVAVSNVKEY